MKVGILTFHRAHNYGAVLQCYALQEVLKSMGHEVWVVDYRQPYIEKIYSVLRIRIILRLILKFNFSCLFDYLKQAKSRYNKWASFTKFRNKWFLIDKNSLSRINQDLDCYVIGSDQLWGLHCVGGEKDIVYLGEFNRKINSKIIGYAISTNIHSLKQLKEEGLGEYIMNFDSLSMREQFAVDFLKTELEINPQVCIDPTLLTNKETWEPLIKGKWKNKKYVLMYQVRYPTSMAKQSFLRGKAEYIAEKLECDIIDVSDYSYSVEDFVSLFKYAQYVVTSSFHGTVFSLIFETPFCVYKLNDGHDERYISLLNNLDLSEHCLDLDEYPKWDEKVIKNRSKFVSIKNASISFLKENIKEV